MTGEEPPKIGLSFGGAPPPEVAAYFREKSLRPAFRWTEVWGQEHAHAFTVAKATQLDVLAAIKASLQDAIDKGVPYQAWAKSLKPELEKHGWWGVKEMVDPATGKTRQVQLGSPRRLQTIYDANLRTARAAGQWERAQRTKAVLPFFVYELGPSMRHRPEHQAREGFIAAVDDPVWNAWYPPNGWGCKCWLQQITRTAADARGGPSDTGDGELATREFTRTRDDGSRETVRVPKGIDPGWATNPGKSRADHLAKMLQEKLDAAGPDLRKAVLKPLPDPFLSDPAAQRTTLAPYLRRTPEQVGALGRALISQAGEHVGKATPEGAASVHWYTGQGYRRFNEKLREGRATPEDKKVLSLLDQTIGQHMPPATAEIWRAPAQNKSEADDLWRKWKKGADAEMSATPVSFSRSPSFAAAWAGGSDLLVKVVAPPRAAAVAAISANPHEDEVMVASGLRWIVKRRYRTRQEYNGRPFRVIELEAVEP